MIILKQFIGIAVLSLLAIPQLSAETKKVELGGLRKVTVAITPKDNGWNIAVTMLPVNCFTSLVNQRISRQYALRYALTVLAEQQQKNTLSVKNHRLLSESEKNNFYTALFYIAEISPVIKKSVPSSLRKIRSDHIETESAITISLNPTNEDLFNRKHDWEQIISSFGNMLIREMSSFTEDYDENELLSNIEEIEKNIISGYRVLSTNIKNDKLLLEQETCELLRLLQLQENITKRHLVALYNQLEITDPRLKKEFAPYICFDPIILNQGGTRIYKLSDQQFVLISVGVVPVKGTSAQTLIKQRQVAKAKAMTNLLKMNGVQISSFEKINDELKITHSKNRTEQYETSFIFLQEIREFAEGNIRSLPTIGTWYSQDKKYFFTAIGALVSYE